MFVTVAIVIALLTGCGGGRSQPNLADQRLAAQLGSRIADAQVELAMTRRDLAVVRQQGATITHQATTREEPEGPTRTVTASVTNASGALSGVLVAFTVHGANAGATGTCVPVDCRSDGNGLVAFTYAATSPGDDSVTIVCEQPTNVTLVSQPPTTTNTTPPTGQPPTTLPPGPPKIFQVELRNCRNLHVGYERFPAGAVVRWTVSQYGVTVATGQFAAAGNDDAYHFLTQPLGVRLDAAPDGAAHFTWDVGGEVSSYTAARAAGC